MPVERPINADPSLDATYEGVSNSTLIGRRVCTVAWRSFLIGVLAFESMCAEAGSGPLGIDSELPLDANGIWARRYQTGVENGVIAVEVAGALWFGNDDKLGHAFWQDIDSTALSGIAAQLLKYAVGRPRPSQGDDPNAFFKGSHYQSFPSGEVTLQAAFVTPLIVDYYKEDPWVWALETLPVYDAIARLKSRAHWQTDVIAGGLLGTGFGYWTTTRSIPLSVQFLPGGVTVGFSKRF